MIAQSFTEPWKRRWEVPHGRFGAGVLRSPTLAGETEVHLYGLRPIARSTGMGHGAVLHGCTIEDNCVIGINATVLDGAVIGSGTIVAAGALVRERTQVPPGSFVAGVPAMVREGRPGQEKTIKLGAVSYSVLARGYQEGKDVLTDEELMKKTREIMEKEGI